MSSSETQSNDKERRKNEEVSSQVIMATAKSTRILYPKKFLNPDERVLSSTASESISISPPSTVPSVPSDHDEDYDKRLRQSITLIWKIPGEYRISENVSKAYHKNRKRYIRDNRIHSGSDNSDSDPKSTLKSKQSKYPGLKSIVSSKPSYKEGKYRLALHETRSIKEVDRVRSTLKKFPGISKCPYNCDCFDCYTLNMPEGSSSDNASAGEEIDPVIIYGGAKSNRNAERLKATEQRRNHRLATRYLRAQGDIKQVEGEIRNIMTQRNSEPFTHIEPLPDFVYEFEIMLENVRKESIFYDGIINICRGLLFLWRCFLIKISRNTKVAPQPTENHTGRDYLKIDIEPPLE